MPSWPWNQRAIGGIVKAASSASIETTVSTSFRSQASAYCSTISRSRSSPSELSVSCWLWSGSFFSTVARARCSALFTEATLVSSVSAVSCAEKPSTSRRISTARWFAGRS